MKDDGSMKSVLAAHQDEIVQILRDYSERAIGRNDGELLVMRREQNALLTTLLAQQKRVMDHLSGEKVEPQAHLGEAVLLPAFGGGGG